jgi:hypothetical protein
MKKKSKSIAPKQELTPAFRALLRELMPQVETHAERQKRFFDFLSSWFTYKDASANLEAFKAIDSFTPSHRVLVAQQFSTWWKHRLTKQRKAIGKTGGRRKKTVTRP